ncbi:hypothetical protein WV31_12970 [Magnetospirillum sp. ME-1]|uniref:sporadic carbohydrate cluster 2OG-Fe(II) oxygenase n=1 Tax=Magnetospirillum sp. ME-1 TaxID=1639348 RepID=UPI000A17F4C7|nr:sporadic carbohydrate cluster 2OG-Fe(II) oxygenase [Magnetospirillum sp. ME-1]ARJ66514.1 hypothetical protein WV31_12970 [Magnetospirillum sp. ME-1]
MSFLTPEEQSLADTFLTDGAVVRPVDDPAALNRIRDHAATLAARHLGVALPADAGTFLDRIHQRVSPAELNALRLAVIEGLNREEWLRPAYFALARKTIETLVGNELCMQRRVNLSIQLPGDTSSLLGAHADVWSGDSPFEVVVWLPLVDCFGTKTMYLCPPAFDRPLQARLAEFPSAEAIFQAACPHLKWLEVKYGEVMVFDQTLMHGNRINEENDTRWSMNCRFKAVLSPYADKKLGEFFEPITLRAATRVGMTYRLPGGYA